MNINSPKYFIRLDDLCPTNNLEKWERFYKLFDKFNIKPIIAVIPENKDVKLNTGTFNNLFWDLVRQMDKKGYHIAMHGFDHVYLTNKSGILKFNNKSEFAGLPLNVQEEKIKKSNNIFIEQGINVKIFVAPAHTFDKNTLIALKKKSNISIISDGLLKTPYKRYGFKWLPLQVSGVAFHTNSTWTFNYHPETCSNNSFNELASFVKKYHHLFEKIENISYNNYNIFSYLSEWFSINKRWLNKIAKKYLVAIFLK